MRTACGEPVLVATFASMTTVPVVGVSGTVVIVDDEDDGGTVVTLSFDTAALAELDAGDNPDTASGEEQLAQLMPIRT